MASYVERGVDAATADGDAAVLLTIDTPGGLDSSMRSIIKDILGSNVPVLCYTAPSGARAASAGTFIMESCPINAMAPGTNIGAAHPVGVSGAIEQEKVTNDAAAFIRSLAQQWNRNPDWAERAVREAISASSTEALKLHVVDTIAPSTQQLFATAGGCSHGIGPQTGLLSKGTVVPGLCQNPTVVPFGMSLTEGFFHSFADPNIAFLLLNLGFIALVVWIIHPAFHFALVIGLVGSIVGFLILQTLPVRPVGIVLLIASAILFVLDLKAHTHGVLTTAGLVTFILGGLFLFNPSVPSAHVSRPLLVVVGVGFALLTGMTMRAVLAAGHRKPEAGAEALVGLIGVAMSDLNPTGTVRARGETWSATTTAGLVPRGAAVRVIAVRGITLEVQPEVVMQPGVTEGSVT
jgi:membrane-bound serine protease (ClpP class)